MTFWPDGPVNACRLDCRDGRSRRRPSWTTRVTCYLLFSRSNAPWMATSFHATCKSCRSSLGRRNTRNWALQRSSTTASMNRTLCRAPNNRKESLLRPCLCYNLKEDRKKKKNNHCFRVTCTTGNTRHADTDPNVKSEPRHLLCIDTWCPLLQQSAVLQADTQTPQQAAASRPQACQRKTLQESSLQMSVQRSPASSPFLLTKLYRTYCVSRLFKWDPLPEIYVWAACLCYWHDRLPSRWRVCPARRGIHPSQTHTEKAQRPGRGCQSRKGPKTQQRHVGAIIQRRGQQRFRGQHEWSLPLSVHSLDIVIQNHIRKGKKSASGRKKKNCLLRFVSCVSVATMFTVKNPEEEQMEAKSDDEEDDFQTDDSEEMEVDKQAQQKRKKVCWKCPQLPLVQMGTAWVNHKYVIVSFRSKEGAFRKNFGTITGNREVRKKGKFEEEKV